ncbi:MAG TPA: hypothetical protein VNV37_09100, partial [Solirubrobacteraceae bacterium]|nr:hypothetical protein [Solirubrobacteraceae bacterium]
MAGATAEFEFEEIAEPKGDDRLSDFSTGSLEHWELRVNELVASLHKDGKRDRDGVPVPELFVFAMSEGDDLLGLCAWIAKSFVTDDDDEPYDEEEHEEGPPIYIHLLGVGERHRRGGLGHNLLLASLEAISQQWTGLRMP